MTTSSDVNPRSGGAGVSVTGAWDVSDSFSVFGLAGWLHDMPTRTGTTSSDGGDVFRFSLGAQWLPHPQWMVMLAVSGSPPSQQTNTTTRRVFDRDVDAIIDSNSYSFGAQLYGGWMSDWGGDFESMVDVAQASIATTSSRSFGCRTVSSCGACAGGATSRCVSSSTA